MRKTKHETFSEQYEKVRGGDLGGSWASSVFKVVKKGTNTEGVEVCLGDVLVAKKYKHVEGLNLLKFKTEKDILRKICHHNNKIPNLLQIIDETAESDLLNFEPRIEAREEQCYEHEGSTRNPNCTPAVIGYSYLIMEYVKGKTLDRILQQMYQRNRVLLKH